MIPETIKNKLRKLKTALAKDYLNQVIYGEWVETLDGCINGTTKLTAQLMTACNLKYKELQK